jgi:hypothetical protein
MPNKISTLARKWGCDVSTIRRWRLDGAPVDAPDWRAMAAWLHGRDHVGRGTKNALHALRRAEREAQTHAPDAPGITSGQEGTVNATLQRSGNPTNAPVTPEEEVEAHAEHLASCAAELSDALAGGSPALKPVFDTWQATLGAIFWYYMAQTSDEVYARAQKFARQQSLTLAAPARVPIRNKSRLP